MQPELENVTLRNEVLALRRFIDSMQNLSDTVHAERTDEELMELLEEVLTNAQRAINAKDGSLLVLDEDTEELVFVITHGDIPHEQLAWRRIPPGEGVAGWVAREKRSTIVHDARTDVRFWDDLDTELGFATNTILAAPIVGGGRVLGVVEVLNKLDGLQFNADDEALLGLMCRFAGELLVNILQRSRIAGEARP